MPQLGDVPDWEIAKILGISRTMVRKRRRALGIEPCRFHTQGKHRLAPIRDAQVLAWLATRGARCIAVIAREFHWPHATTRNSVNRLEARGQVQRTMDGLVRASIRKAAPSCPQVRPQDGSAGEADRR